MREVFLQVSKASHTSQHFLSSMSLADSKPGESWTELDPPDDSTYSLPIFLSVGDVVLYHFHITHNNKTNFHLQYSDTAGRRGRTFLHHLFELWSSQALQAWRPLWPGGHRLSAHCGLQRGRVQPHVQGRGEVRAPVWPGDSGHWACFSGRLPPCLNCILIEMGEMACYQDCCPQCGRVPPSRLQAKIKYFKRNKGRSSRPCRQPAADGQDRLQVSARQAGPHNYPV